MCVRVNVTVPGKYIPSICECTFPFLGMSVCARLHLYGYRISLLFRKHKKKRKKEAKKRNETQTIAVLYAYSAAISAHTNDCGGRTIHWCVPCDMLDMGFFCCCSFNHIHMVCGECFLSLLLQFSILCEEFASSGV